MTDDTQRLIDFLTLPPHAVLEGDCLERVRRLPDDSIDAIVTDPPYGLGKEPDALAMLSDWLGSGHHDVRGSGFMGKAWDAFVPQPALWRECLRVLKPGGHLLAFAGTRTHDLMTLGLRIAGFEIRDTIMWVYSTGFPKSLNLDRERGKTICGCSRQPVPYAHEKAPGESKAQREVRAVLDAHVPEALDSGEGRGEVLQPRLQEQGASIAGRSEPPSPEVRGQQPGVEGRRDPQEAEGELQGRAVCQGSGVGEAYGSRGRVHHGASAGHGADLRVPADSHGSRGPLGPRPVEQPPVEPRSVPDERGPQARGAWSVCAGCGKPRLPEGLGTALKPALEPITVARKPLAGTVAANVLAHGTGAINIDGCRVGSEGGTKGSNYAKTGLFGVGGRAGIDRLDAGRWPANLVHDGSDEVLAGFPSKAGASAPASGPTHEGASKSGSMAGHFNGMGERAPAFHGDSGSAARFFYCAKASKADRDEGLEGFAQTPSGVGALRDGGRQCGGRRNTHPTVKPTALMRWLVRLVTPPGGLVLDPFAGSGSTGKACKLEGFRFIGCELDPEYAAIARARIEGASE